MPLAGDLAFVFGPFRLVPRQRVLLRDNRPVRLGGRALDILHLLVMRAGEEVSKTELIAHAWPRVFVDERNLKVHISSLRRALDDTLPHATFIATVVGHGYQFVERVVATPVDGADFPAEEPSAPPGLPALSPLVGRQRDVDGIARALEAARLVTLVGPGGVGKTRLAIALAHARQDRFPDGVHFLDLSATDDVALVPHLVAAELVVRGGAMDLTAAVTSHLRGKRVLLVLDNCEHVLPGVAAFAGRFVETVTDSCLLATSRLPLGVAGEEVQRVEPLAFPPRAEVRSSREALAYPSVELFAMRALEATDYHLVDRDAHVVASLCEALDGLPLAIEIAAAKLDQFSPADLLDSVGRRLLDHDDDAPSRQQTLWATLDWSYRLLSAQESQMFRLLSVFIGSFEWTEVTGMAKLAPYDPHQTTVALGGLVARSLLTAEIDGEQIRYRLHETVRTYAAEQLLRDPLAQEAQLRHAQLVLAAFEKSSAEWAWVDSRVWRARYEARTADLRKALDWCFEEGGGAALGIDLSIAAMRFWNEQSTMFEQLFQVERALRHCASVADAPLRKAMLATSRAWCMSFGGQLHAATDDAWDEAIRFAEESGDVAQHLSVMCGMSLFLVATGRLEHSVRLLDDVIRLAAQAGDRAALFDGERLRAMAEARRGNVEDARRQLEALAADLARGVPASKHVRYQLQSHVSIHGMLAFSTWLGGRPERALVIAEELVRKTGEDGHLMGQSRVLALFALPLVYWSKRIDVFERYAKTLGTNLERGHLVMWEQVHRFYEAAGRHLRGDLGAVVDMRRAIDELVRSRFLERTPMYLAMLAEALLDRGRSAEADVALREAMTLQSRTQENWCVPELLRLSARVLVVRGDRDGARETLLEARRKARTFGARSFELRVMKDLARVAGEDGSDEESAADAPAARE